MMTSLSRCVTRDINISLTCIRKTQIGKTQIGKTRSRWNTLRAVTVTLCILLGASRVTAQSDAALEARAAVLRQNVTHRYGPPSVYALMSADHTSGALETLHVDLKIGDTVVVISDSDGFVAFSVSGGGDQFLRAGPAPGDKQRTGFGEMSASIQHNIAGTLMLGGTGGVAHVFIIPKANQR
jgi:hypothetical protein